MRTRIPERGRLLASLRTLLRRVERFGVGRAAKHEQAWAARFADELTAAYVAALSAPGARAALEAVDRRAAVRRKTPAPPQDRNLLAGGSEATLEGGHP